MKSPAWRALTRSPIDVAVLVELDVGLRDDVLVLFPRRQIEAVGLELDALLLRPAVGADQLVGLDDVADLVLRVAAGVGDDRRSRRRWPSLTLRYGDSMKPKSLMRA